MTKRFMAVLAAVFFVAIQVYAQAYKPETKNFEQAVLENKFEDVKFYVNKTGSDFEKRKKLVNQKFKDKSLPLIKAIESDNADIVRFLIVSGAEVNIVDRKYNPFTTAVMKNEDIAKLFIESKRLSDNTVNSTFVDLAAVKEGAFEKIKFLEESGFKPDSVINFMLLNAAVSYNKPLIEYLLSKGADLNSSEFERFSYPVFASLSNASDNDDLMEIINYYKSKGADMSISALRNMYVAINKENTALIEYLLTQLPKEQQDKKDKLLVTAAFNGKLESVKYLVKKGFDVNAKDKITFVHNKSEEELSDRDKLNNEIKLLLQHYTKTSSVLLINGGSISGAIGCNDVTPLMAASAGKHIEIVKFLVDSGADINAQSAEGFTALFFAALSQSTESADILIEKGTSADARAKDGSSALLFAAANNDMEMVKILVENGAVVYVKNDKAYTPYKVTKSKEIQKYLKEQDVLQKQAAK